MRILTGGMGHRLNGLLPGAAVAAMCAFAFSHGVRTTHDLDWPYDQDLYRDIAQAQVFRDGNYGADPFYRGHSLWYGPLLPFVVATISRLLDLPVATVYTRLGAYVNLAAPLAFYLLACRLLGRWAAVAAVFGLLFLRAPDAPSWTEATYSPWLFSSNFAQALFYVALLAYRRAWISRRPLVYAAAGAVLGLTFLAHAAPVLVMAVVLAVVVLWSRAGSARARWRPLVRRHGLLVGCGLLVSLPLLWSILGRYHLQVRNPAPGLWSWPPLQPENALGFLASQLSPLSAVTVVGALHLFRRVGRRLDPRLLLAWAAGCLLLFAYATLASAARPEGIALPTLVPAFHFFFYGTAAASLMFGHGLHVLGLWAARPFMRLVDPRHRLARLLEPAVVAVCLLVLAGYALPSYPQRFDFTTARQRAQELGLRQSWQQARHWIRSHTRAGDVFLCVDEPALFVVGPAGRKVVALEDVFSNPYVEWEGRAEAREGMFADLRAGQFSRFLSTASAQGVTYVLVTRVERPWLRGVPPTVLEEEWAAGGLEIHRILPRAAGPTPGVRPGSCY